MTTRFRVTLENAGAEYVDNTSAFQLFSFRHRQAVNHPGLYRYSIAVSLWVLILVAAGSLVTTEAAGRVIPDWPLAFGSVFPHIPGATVLIALLHRYVAAIAVLLVAGLAIAARRSRAPRSARNFAFIALVLILAQSVLGGASIRFGAAGWIGLVHAGLAQLVLVATAAVAFVISPFSGSYVGHLHDYGWPSLRALALITPPLVFVQVMLGALFRHHMTGLIPHVVGAMIVGGLVMLLALFTLTQFPKHESLRGLSTAVFLTLACQLVLGVAAYALGASAEQSQIPSNWTAAVVAMHVVCGGVLFVFCCLLAVQVRRCVLPKLEPATRVQAAS